MYGGQELGSIDSIIDVSRENMTSVEGRRSEDEGRRVVEMSRKRIV